MRARFVTVHDIAAIGPVSHTTLHMGALTYGTPKVTTHPVGVPVPSVITPALSLPTNEGDVPQDDSAGTAVVLLLMTSCGGLGVTDPGE